MYFAPRFLFGLTTLLLVQVISLLAHTNSLYTGLYLRDGTLDGKQCPEQNIMLRKYNVKVVACLSVCQEVPSCRIAVHQESTRTCFVCRRHFTWEDYTEMTDLDGTTVWNRINIPKTDYVDCKRIQLADAGMADGVYRIYPVGGSERLNVMCDMTDGVGGYTVFQQRTIGDLDFNRSFTEYESGFGSVFKDHWLGLTYIHRMTFGTIGSDILLVFYDKNNKRRYQKFDGFIVDGPPGYVVKLGNILSRNDRNGVIEHDTTDSFYDSLGQSFSTYDRDQDNDTDLHCAADQHGGWWFSHCGPLNPNGQYSIPGTNIGWQGIVNYPFQGLESLKSTSLMFRP